ncbi:MAG: PAS domain S-box protein [Steroidobacteraceae bacterium]|jgi:PAS domain S-box-containing protein|nr:PAS domain S-box protein [Steroidobacteraceae bacterium]
MFDAPAADRADRRGTPSLLAAYAGAALIATAIVLLRAGLAPLLGDQAPFLILLIAPAVAAAWAGFGPGLLATVICLLAGAWLFLEPFDPLHPSAAPEWFRMSFFVLEGALFSWLFEERRRATLEARGRERRFREAIEAAPSGMILADGDGRVAFANASACRGFGYTPDEFRQLSIEDLVPPDLRDSHRQDRAAFLRLPTPRAMGLGRELRARHKDGSEFPVEIGLSPVPTEGAPLVLAAVVDVSERQRAATKLVDSERRQRFLLQLTERLQSLQHAGEMMDAATRALGEFLGVAQLGYGEIDAAQEHVIVARDWNDGRIRSVVGTWRMDDFGPAFIRDMKAGRSVAIADVADDPRTNAPEVLRAYAGIQTRVILDTPLIRDGRMVAMIFTHHPEPRAWSPDEVVLAEETCARIWTAVERVRAERAARISLELLDRAGEAARVGAFIHHLEQPGGPRWSDRLFDILGVPRGTPPSTELAVSRHPPAVRSVLREAIVRMEQVGEPLEIELPLLPQAGSASWVRIYAVPTMRDGRCVEISGAVQDISDRKQLELEVVAATNQERERIGADLHDDLGQVLTAVTLQVGAFRRTLGQDAPLEARRQELEAIERNLEHARTACRRLARAYVAPVSATSFLAMLRQMARDASGACECLVHGTELPAATPTATARELFRIAQEALNNALKHSHARRIEMDLQVDAERLTLAIEDDGVGLPPGELACGVGLTSMRSRAARIGGIVLIGAGRRGGVRVVVTCARADSEADASAA